MLLSCLFYIILYLIKFFQQVFQFMWVSMIIMRPFLGKSAINGLYAGVLASVLLVAMVIAMGRGIPEMSFLVDDTALAIVCTGTMCAGVVISVLFTAAAVRRVTRLQGGELYI